MEFLKPIREIFSVIQCVFQYHTSFTKKKKKTYWWQLFKHLTCHKRAKHQIAHRHVKLNRSKSFKGIFLCCYEDISQCGQNLIGLISDTVGYVFVKGGWGGAVGVGWCGFSAHVFLPWKQMHKLYNSSQLRLSRTGVQKAENPLLYVPKYRWQPTLQ